MAVATLKHTPKTHAEALAVLMGAGKSQVVLGPNTLLTETARGIVVSYHGNDIVRYTMDTGTYVRWAGWPTATTTGRIAQLVNERVNIIKGKPAIDGVTVDELAWHPVG